MLKSLQIAWVFLLYFAIYFPMNVKKDIVLFWILLVVFLIKGVYYSLFIPPWEAPDEPGHVAYVHYLYQSRTFPDNTKKPINDLSMQNSLMYQRTLLVKMQKGVAPQRKELFNRNQYRVAVFKGNIAGNPPLY